MLILCVTFNTLVSISIIYLCYLTCQAPLFGNIFDELCLPDDLWQDVDKIPLLSEITTKEPETISRDEKLKITSNTVI